MRIGQIVTVVSEIEMSSMNGFDSLDRAFDA